LGHILPLSQSPRQVDDVLGLASGVGIAAEFQITAPDQAVDADQNQILHSVFAFPEPLRLSAYGSVLLNRWRIRGARPGFPGDQRDTNARPTERLPPKVREQSLT